MGVSSMVSVSFPVDAHVRKYLNIRYGNVHIARKTTVLGTLVLQALSKRIVKPDKTISANYRYTILIPEDDLYRRGHSVSRNKEQHIGACVTRLFNEAMYEHLDMAVRDGEKALPTLKKFLAHYFISEDDVKVESLYKAYQRHCRMSIKSRSEKTQVKK